MPLLTTGAGRFPAAAGGGADSAAYTNFIARTSGLNGAHLAAYKALLDGLTTDGLFNSDGTTSVFDALYIFATADTTTAALNLCGATFNGNPTSLTFTADSGYTATSGQNFQTSFNPSTATSPKYVQNSAHLSVWNLVNSGTTSVDISSGSLGQNLIFLAGSIYARVNDNPESSGFTASDFRGHIFGNRSSSTARQLYQNASTTLIGGTVATYPSTPSQAPNNADIIGISSGDHTIAMISIGASLNSTQITNFYNRLRTYMTAVGVP